MSSLQGVFVRKFVSKFVLHFERNLAPVVVVFGSRFLEQVLAPFQAHQVKQHLISLSEFLMTLVLFGVIVEVP